MKNKGSVWKTQSAGVWKLESTSTDSRGDFWFPKLAGAMPSHSKRKICMSHIWKNSAELTFTYTVHCVHLYQRLEKGSGHVQTKAEKENSHTLFCVELECLSSLLRVNCYSVGLRVNSDDFSSTTPDKQHPFQALCQHLKKFHIWISICQGQKISKPSDP